MPTELIDEKEKVRIDLDCKEAGLVLRATPLDKQYQEMSDEERAALDHYTWSGSKKDFWGCLTCKKQGLGKIKNRNLSCKDALEIWAIKPGPFFLSGYVETIDDYLALEHIWGRRVPVPEKERRYETSLGNEHVDNCREFVCTQLRDYWRAAPIHLAYDGEKETGRKFLFS